MLPVDTIVMSPRSVETRSMMSGALTATTSSLVGRGTLPINSVLPARIPRRGPCLIRLSAFSAGDIYVVSSEMPNGATSWLRSTRTSWRQRLAGSTCEAGEWNWDAWILIMAQLH